jgi:glycosyltransferase involved in cell wall biosynthesis
MNKKENKSNNTIAYILGTYPYLTTTFIDREILAVKKRQVNLILIAIRKPAPFEMNSEILKLTKEIKYILPVSWYQFLKINISLILTKPLRYLKIFLYLITRFHRNFSERLKTLCHFYEGIYVVQLLRRSNVNHIHAHFADRAAIVAMVAAKFLNLPYSVTAHANDIYVSPVMLKEKIENAKFVTTCTLYNKMHLEHLTGNKIELVYHGIDIDSLRSANKPEPHEEPELILSVGQLKEKKGFSFLIKACHLLKARGFNFVCEIIGDGPERLKLQGLIEELALKDTVILCGSLPHKNVMERYQYAKLFVLSCVPAKDEDRDGIPNVLLEAMGYQVPVVSTRFSGIPEVIENGVNGILVDTKNEKTLAEAMALVLNDLELRKKLASNGRKTLEDKFDVNKNIEKLIRLFNNSEKF